MRQWGSPRIRTAAALMPLWLAIAFSASFARIAVGPVYALDVATTVSFVSVALISIYDFRQGTIHPPMPALALLAVVPALSTLRLFSAEISLMALRDYAPFLYFLYAALVAWVLGTSQHHERIWASKMVFWALAVHWALIVFMQSAMHLNNINALNLSFEWIEIRPDLDGALIGALAASIFLSTKGADLKTAYARYILIVVLVLHAASLDSRAAVLATVVMAVVAATWSASAKSLRWREFIKLGILVLLPLSVAVPQMGVGQKFAGGIAVISEKLSEEVTPENFASESPQKPLNMEVPSMTRPSEIDSSQQDSQEPKSAFSEYLEFGGPTNARLKAWSVIVPWIFSDAARSIMGAGFGSDHLEQSGAREMLVGDNPVQETIHPHNFLIQITATMGLPVTIFLSGLLAYAWSRNLEPVECISVAKIILIGIVTPSLFGVVWEHPVGAIIFAGGLGMLFVPSLRSSREINGNQTG